ncbi:MAG: pyruvate dehydrogenase (acetyl-transferring) E1 component subunit alpha [Armatimonadetes bacterium RBG_16_58_9]|nr:MAG: pyruvate dehydrogenase (acetyl-transferring) E1 component subunit alpha [Armatimonadetes bacterium RBG_16_58_9]
MHRTMLKIRAFEEEAERLYKSGAMPGFIHLYLGEEAVATGVCASLRDDDCITSTHRGHGHVIAKGADARGMMAELYAKETGYCKGRGGSMHIADFRIGILGANGIVGGGTPIAVGAALGFQLKRTDRVVACFFGDGASNEGSFHESLNLASIWNLPVVFVCENNQYAVSTHQSAHQKVKDISVRAAAYDIEGVSVDGNDVLAVYRVASKAVERARMGDGPTLIECKTYRMAGHYVGDPENYRARQEKEDWMKGDPIARFGGMLRQWEVLSQEKEGQIRDDVTREIAEAIKFAEASPDPRPEGATMYVYCDQEADDR